MGALTSDFFHFHSAQAPLSKQLLQIATTRSMQFDATIIISWSVPRRPCNGDVDDDHNDATDIQNTHRRPSLSSLFWNFQPGKGKVPGAMCSLWQ